MDLLLKRSQAPCVPKILQTDIFIFERTFWPQRRKQSWITVTVGPHGKWIIKDTVTDRNSVEFFISEKSQTELQLQTETFSNYFGNHVETRRQEFYTTAGGKNCHGHFEPLPSISGV